MRLVEDTNGLLSQWREVIVAAVPLEEVARRYTPLEQFGGAGWWTGPCPLADHGTEETPFYIGPSRRWECYECERAGDVVDLEFLCGNYGDPSEAMKAVLASEYGVELPKGPELGLGEESSNGSNPKRKEDQRNQADRLIGYAFEDAEALFRDQHGEPHALVDGRPVPLNSRCYSWLRRLNWQEEQRAVNGEYLKTAAGTLAAYAEFSGDVRELYTRAAWNGDALYYELRPGRVVKVDADGWCFDSDPPVLFRRFPNLKPLPDPEPGGSLDAIGALVNLKTERDRRLFVAYLATVPLPHVGRPILNVAGAMGSGKTTIARVVKRTWDPTAPESVRFDPRDFLQKASHAYVVELDNQNSIPEWAADTLCRLVTGEADSKRRLYTDDEDVIVELKRAVLLNGINVPTDRGDVLDRSLVVELERIPDGERKTEEELWERFEAEHPKLLGALFDVLAQAIARKPSIKLSRRPRLADWGEYAAAVYEVMGWGAETFLKDWDEIVKVQNQATLDGSPVAQAIIKFMESREEEEEEYVGAASDLHKKLEGVAESLGVSITRDKAWPKSARWLWRRIKEVLPLLVVAGIEATREHTDRGTAIALRRVPRNDVSNVREGESGEDKGETSDINEGLTPKSNVRDDSNVRANVSRNPAKQAGSDITDDTDIRYGDSSEAHSAGDYDRPDESCIHGFPGGKGCCLCDSDHPYRSAIRAGGGGRT